MPESWEDLANGIIIQAVKDYRNARRRVRTKRDQKGARATIREVEHFLRSRWYAQLTDLDGEILLERLQKEVVLK